MDENNKYLSNILDASKRGSIKSYYQLVTMYIDNVFALSLRLTGNYESAREVCFSTFVFAWKNIQQVRMNSTFIAWLHGVAIFYTLQKFRVNKQELEPRTLSLTLRISNIDNGLLQLKPEERIIVTLVDIKGYALSEVKDILPEFSHDEIKHLLYSGRLKISDGLRR